MGNIQAKDQPVVKFKLQRKIKMKGIFGRLSRAETEKLQSSFNRMQENSLINKYIFRMEVLGTQVPDVISERIFSMFATQYTGTLQQDPATIGNGAGPDSMSFEDFISCYIVFSQQNIYEMAQLQYEMLKLSKDQESIQRDDLVHFCVRIVQLNENFVNLFFKKTKLDPRIPILKQEFVDIYHLVNKIELFNIIPQIICGFKNEYLNIESSLYQDKSMGLSEIQMEQIQEKHFAISQEESENLAEFFDEEIRGKDPKPVLEVYMKLLGEIKSKSLLLVYIDALTRFKGNDFEFFNTLVSYSVKHKKYSTEQKMSLIFDVFSGFQKTIKPDRITQICQIFELQLPFCSEMGKPEFQKTFKIEETGLEEAKYMIMGMLGLRSDSGGNGEEYLSILAVLGQREFDQIDLSHYANKNLHKEQTFYIVEKEFWVQWCNNSQKDNKLELRPQPKLVMDNEKLVEPGHSIRLRENKYHEEHFVICPKYVFKPLSKWYKCNKVLELNVHESKIGEMALRQASRFSMQSRPNQSRQDSRGSVLRKSDERGSQQTGGEATQTDKILVNSFKNVSLPRRMPNSYQKIHGDSQYDLEIYPCLIFFQKVNHVGKMLHQAALFGNKIDQGYIKKHCNKKVPFEEIAVSRKTTFDTLLKHFAEVYDNQNPKKARLLIEEQVLSGLKLADTIEEFGLKDGQLVYIEFLESNNIWPTDKQRALLEEESKKKIRSSGAGYGTTVGLYNIGNSCYLNSAMQCLINIRQIHEYYVRDQLYMKQMNNKNPMGHQGDLVQAFGSLVQQLWNSNQVVVPKGFKYILGKLNEQFKGDEQQDSQEYVNFMIDALHEETNLRNEKPYIENPESANRDLIELGLESWSNNLKREWSFVFFMFYGQMKSTIECLTCKKESTTFDVFTNIPVSLPEPSQLLLNIVVHRLPSKIKRIINRKPNDRENNGDGPIAKKLPDTPQGSNGLQKEIENQEFEANYSQLTNDQPIHIIIKVDKNIHIKTLINKILQIKEVNIDPALYKSQAFSELILFSKSLGIVRGIYEPTNRFTQYKMITNEIHATETLTARGREYVKLMYEHDTNLWKETAGILQTLQYDDQPLMKAKKEKGTPQFEPFNKGYIYNNFLAACDKFDQLEKQGKIPDDIIVVAYHRRFVQKSELLFQTFQPQLLSSPLLLQLSNKPTGRRIYEEIWSIAHRILKADSKYLDKDQLWWNQKNWHEQMVRKRESGASRGGLKPFVLKMVDRQGYSCSQCNWTQRCSGCIIEPDESTLIDQFLKKAHIAIEWHSQMIEDEYNPSSNEILRHSSIMSEEADMEEEVISLEQCLQKFHDIEKLTDPIYCRGCKTHRDHQKSFQTFRPPPVLTVQLKRFKRIGNSWRKLQTLVDFPINNLDLSNYVQSCQFLQGLDIPTQYDLMGIINHYGSLTYGHYISVVKNPYDNSWYRYDDHSRLKISESQIQKENAYILFYVRKDTYRKQLSDLMPTMNKIFPGKPILTRHGEGYILGAKAPDARGRASNKWYCKIREDIMEITEKDIVPDPFVPDGFKQFKPFDKDDDGVDGQPKTGVSSIIASCLGTKRKESQVVDQDTEKQKLVNNIEDSPKEEESQQLINESTSVPDINKQKTQISQDNSIKPLIQVEMTEQLGDNSFIDSTTQVKKKKKKKRKKQPIGPAIESL